MFWRDDVFAEINFRGTCFEIKKDTLSIRRSKSIATCKTTEKNTKTLNSEKRIAENMMQYDSSQAQKEQLYENKTSNGSSNENFIRSKEHFLRTLNEKTAQTQNGDEFLSEKKVKQNSDTKAQHAETPPQRCMNLLSSIKQFLIFLNYFFIF